MRDGRTYRGARRNHMRSIGKLADWRHLRLADKANAKAKLGARRTQCRDAVAHVSKAMVGSGGGKPAMREAFRQFWAVLPARTRVVSRILRELRA